MNWVFEQAEAYLSLFLIPYSLFLTLLVGLLYVVESHRARRDKHIYIFPAKYYAAPPCYLIDSFKSITQSNRRQPLALLALIAKVQYGRTTSQTCKAH